MPSIKTTISLSPSVYRAAKAKSERFFGGNFSAYICYLICRNNDMEDVRRVNK